MLPSKPERRTGSYILAGLSSLLLAVTVFVGGREIAFVFHASRATGIFAGAVARSGGNHGGTFLYPQFKFVTGDGQNVEMTSRFGSTNQPYNDGQKESVLYDPQKPTHAVLDHFWILWAPTVVLGFITLLLVGITGGIWRSSPR